MTDEHQLKTYIETKNAVEHNLNLVTGTIDDRIAGLQPLLETAKGKTVLDIGCHVGRIAREFAAFGAAAIDGVDFYRPGLVEATTALAPYPAASRFLPCDLSGGFEALRDALSPMPKATISSSISASITIWPGKWTPTPMHASCRGFVT